jgi:hypothetical protein
MQRPLSQVLLAAATETGELSRAAERLQSLAGDLIRRAGGKADAGLLEEAQGLDALAQTLAALTGFLRRVAEDAPNDVRLDLTRALAAIPLSDLANRLSHQDAPPSLAMAPKGDCELF